MKNSSLFHPKTNLNYHSNLKNTSSFGEKIFSEIEISGLAISEKISDVKPCSETFFVLISTGLWFLSVARSRRTLRNFSELTNIRNTQDDGNASFCVSPS